jgi:Leucine-rich repeat (LRR) protein
LPNEIGSLQSLQSLFIDHFTRPGAGLSGTLPSLSNAPYLSEVHLNSNSLTGRIPTDFLSGVDDTNRMIVVGLRSNRLSGRIPRELGRFDNLNIDLAENWITGISSSLCSKSNWMDGRVGVYGCNAILCPNSTANRYGKQTSNSSSCIDCAEAESSDSYYGTTQCLTDVKRKERAILTNLYNSCGGKKWFKSENWLNDNVDICDWYGISCKPGGSVQAILLGSNNLVGSIPSDLFDIENLQWLWLYSNPITFSFVGVQNAVHLQSLLLGSTGLKSLNGISGAFELKELDIRFNSVSGPFPSELLQLVNLESLLMSKNYLTGSIPDLGSLSNLKILQLGQNQISGQLNPFATLGSLSTLDISSNKISGTIPRNFLQAVSSDVNIFVDLSNNYIEGTVPGDLGRFDQVSLYLQDNFITGISSNLCSMRSWNGGDVGSYDCSGILCPAQTYAVGSGRAGSNNTQCLLCGMAKYYGQTKCEDLRARKPSISSSSNSEAHGSRVIRGVLAGLGVIVSGVIITYAVYRYKQGREY